MEIRELKSEEREAAFYLGSQAFMNGSRDMSRLDHADRLARKTFGVWDAAGLQTMVGVVEYQIHLGADAIVPMGGIAAVACLPASRGKGYAGQCLKYSLERMREAGQVVSTLFPFSYEYYDRFGWAWTGVQRTYEVKTSALKGSPETEEVRAATEADRPTIAEAYTEFARRYRGVVVRGEKLWTAVLNSTEKEYRYTYLYEKEGRVEGYLTYKGGNRESTQIRELIALTPRSQRALLGLLRRHEMQIDKFKWDAPSDDTLWSTLMHWDLKTTIEPVTQARIVDVPAALAAWRPSAGAYGRTILAVKDAAAPWNEGIWSVEFAGGEVAATRTSEVPHISLEIRALSQAYFGTPGVAEIRGAGQMAVHDEAGYNALANLFEGPPMWMNDSF